MKWPFARRRTWFAGQRLVFLAGFVVIAARVVCLYLSDAVARPGSWWQGTLDPFGVGFIVGGLIDVLAISALNQAIAAEERRQQEFRQEANQQAEVILQHMKGAEQRAQAATALLNLAGDQIDPRLRQQLRDLGHPQFQFPPRIDAGPR